MFEIEKMEKEFDYSLVDNNTAEFLRSCEYEMNGIAEDARVKFGRVLKKAQDKLANGGNGVFQQWYESGGLKESDVYYYINLYKFPRNLGNKEKDNFLKAPKSLQVETMKKNAPEELKEGVLSGDITTHKKYKELEQAKQQAEQQTEQAKNSEQIMQKQLEELENKEPERIEVVPDDYDEVKGNYEASQRLRDRYKEENEQLRSELEKLSQDIKSNKLTGDEGDIERREKEVKLLQLDASKSVLKTKITIDEFLQNVAFTSYRRGAIASSSDGTKNKLHEGLDDLKNFINEMESALDGTIEN